MIENLCKTYRSNEEGKREFVDEVIRPLVINENHFRDAVYVSNERGEYIMLYKYGQKQAEYMINVTADSIEALVRDFMKQFLKCIDLEFWGKEYEKKFGKKEEE